MDPDLCWARIMHIAERISNGQEEEGSRCYTQAVDDLAELLVSLDEWMANGGFPPARFDRVKGR